MTYDQANPAFVYSTGWKDVSSKKALNEKVIPWKPLFTPKDDVYDFVTTKQDIYMYTPRNAPRFKVLKTSLDQPDLASAETVIPEPPGATLTSLALTSKGLFYTLSFNGVREELYHLEYDGKQPEKIDTPFDASVV